jgi:hypothetical protein
MWYGHGFGGGEGVVRPEIVGDNTESVRNRGVADPGGRIDVLVYTLTQEKGDAGCIRRGARGELPEFWENTISSYEWVTRRTCNAHFQIPLL